MQAIEKRAPCRVSHCRRHASAKKGGRCAWWRNKHFSKSLKKHAVGVVEQDLIDSKGSEIASRSRSNTSVKRAGRTLAPPIDATKSVRARHLHSGVQSTTTALKVAHRIFRGQ